MKTADNLFQESIKHYKELLTTASQLSENIAKLSFEEIFEQCEALNDMQRHQQHIDRFIVEIMVATGPQVLLSPNIGEYQRILSKARRICDEIAYKVTITQFSLHNEIEALKDTKPEFSLADSIDRRLH